MKKKIGQIDAILFLTILIAIFFILHFGGTKFLCLNIGKKYAKDGEITKKEAVLIAVEYFKIRNFIQIYNRYKLVTQENAWRSLRDGDVWILAARGRQFPDYRPDYLMRIHVESGVILGVHPTKLLSLRTAQPE